MQLLTKADNPKDKDYTPPKIFEAKVASTAIDAIAFSPNGWFLAVGSHDTTIEIFDCRRRPFHHCGHGMGHSSTVIALDWSTDSRVLRSCSVRERACGRLIRSDRQCSTLPYLYSPVSFPCHRSCPPRSLGRVCVLTRAPITRGDVLDTGYRRTTSSCTGTPGASSS
jgi:WD40 repeat protein